MHLFINYIDLSHLFEFSLTRLRMKSLRGCTDLPSWPTVSGLIPGAASILSLTSVISAIKCD